MPRSDDYTLQSAITSFLRSKRNRLAESSLSEYTRVCEHFLEDLGTDTLVSDLEPPDGTEILEEFLDERWGGTPHAYNRNMSVVKQIIKHLLARGHLDRDPTLPIERKRPERHQRTTFDEETIQLIIAAAESPRDRVALRLMLVYGLRKGGVTNLLLSGFDRQRRTVSFLTKGNKFHTVPIAGDLLWADLDDVQGEPDHHLLGRRGRPELAMSAHGIHAWWYRRLADAGVVEPGTTSGQRMHKARHSAGQRLLDKTGNLKAAQQLLGHASVATTGDVYAGWDDDQLRESMGALDE